MADASRLDNRAHDGGSSLPKWYVDIQHEHGLDNVSIGRGRCTETQISGCLVP